jgi:hypothetical protein
MGGPSRLGPRPAVADWRPPAYDHGGKADADRGMDRQHGPLAARQRRCGPVCQGLRVDGQETADPEEGRPAG